MKEIIEYIKSFKREISIINVYNWSIQNNKEKEMVENQYLVIQLIKEHNRYIEESKKIGIKMFK